MVKEKFGEQKKYTKSNLPVKVFKMCGKPTALGKVKPVCNSKPIKTQSGLERGCAPVV